MGISIQTSPYMGREVMMTSQSDPIWNLHHHRHLHIWAGRSVCFGYLHSISINGHPGLSEVGVEISICRGPCNMEQARVIWKPSSSPSSSSWHVITLHMEISTPTTNTSTFRVAALYRKWCHNSLTLPSGGHAVTWRSLISRLGSLTSIL